MSLKSLKLKKPQNVSMCFININSIRNKLSNLFTFLNKNTDVIIIAETKLDSSFSSQQFFQEGFKIPYRLDCSKNKGGLLVYINENIPSRELKMVSTPKDIQILTFELNLRKRKWLIIAIYKPPNQNDIYFLNHLEELLEYYLCTYDDYIIIGDFNLKPTESSLKDFMNNHGCKNLINSPTCYKSLENPSCIDLIITNRKDCFQYSQTIETGLSDHHKLIYTMMKSTFEKLPPKKLFYRCYNRFSNEVFITELRKRLYLCHNLSYFIYIVTNLLNELAPIKTKVLRGNNKNHVNKDLRKAIMKRSRLKKIALKRNTPETWLQYKKQKNKVVNLNRKTKKDYFNSINLNDTQNKSLWKICNSYLSNNTSSKDRIILVEKDVIISENLQTANIFNSYFTNIVTNLNIPQWEPTNHNYDPNNPVLSAIKKYSNHPSIIRIKKEYGNEKNKFSFRSVTPCSISKRIKKLNSKKKSSGEIPVYIFSRETCFECHLS